jgi:hypothetical protein
MGVLRQMDRLIAIGFMAGVLQFNVAHANEPCLPYERLLENPYVKNINACIFSLTRTLNNAERRTFAVKLINRALNDKKHGDTIGPGLPLNYVKLAELAALINNVEVVDAFLTFIARSSDDEVRSYAMGRLYELRTPLVLERLALRSKKDQYTIIGLIAWGLANNFYLFMNLNNYHRLSVGANWQVLDSKHPHRALSLRVETSLRSILDRPS